MFGASPARLGESRALWSAGRGTGGMAGGVVCEGLLGSDRFGGLQVAAGAGGAEGMAASGKGAAAISASWRPRQGPPGRRAGGWGRGRDGGEDGTYHRPRRSPVTG